MALRIMRVDKREETRASEIVKDWRKWATDNGYIKKGSLPVEQGRMSITSEIPTTTDTEVLYILNDKDQLERMSGISKHLASDLMRRIQLHADMINGNDRINGNSLQA